MTENKLVIVLPFRLQFKVFKFAGIQDLKWDLWGIHRLGDYRQVNILTNSGFRTNISDFEFINYDSLEKWLIDKTDLKLNLDRKLNIELQQAKWNKWLNLVAIVMFVLFFFLFSNGRIRTDIRFGIQIAIVIITWRLLVRLVQYQQRINRSKQRK